MSDESPSTTRDIAVPTSADTEPTREQLIAMLTTDPDEGSAESAADVTNATSSSPVETASAADSAETPKDPKAERVAARVTAVVKSEKRIAAEQSKLQAERAQLDARAKELAEQEARYKLLAEDPLKAFETLKLDPKDFLQKLAGHTDPNAVNDRRLAEVERRLAEREKAIEAAENAARRREQEAQVSHVEQNAKQAFIQHVTAAETYPTLVSEFTPEEILHHAMALVTEHGAAYEAEHGEPMSDETIAGALEDFAKRRAERRSTWRQPAQPSQGNSRSQNAQSVTSQVPRTLTNGAASQKASAPKPWDQREADEESIRLIKAMSSHQ